MNFYKAGVGSTRDPRIDNAEIIQALDNFLT